ncbi:hypothetical protein LSS_11068 [Leptospira santarosai serovar Shermani str. LT 821]|uniref:Uncharacterized protein n=1 Tax=Leptospira santarosai serovar Shermani str. LT 821 TaxID=758847 RepID=K8XZC6_9LEPT|nr:hypothetical protein LSS_11068 [Leptospira santarosai serovar Shermani str. LT 821]
MQLPVVVFACAIRKQGKRPNLLEFFVRIKPVPILKFSLGRASAGILI